MFYGNSRISKKMRKIPTNDMSIKNGPTMLNNKNIPLSVSDIINNNNSHIDKPKIFPTCQYILTNPNEKSPGFLYADKVYPLPFDYSDVCNVWNAGGFYLMQTPKQIHFFKFEDDETGRVISHKKENIYNLPDEVVASYDSTFYFKN